MLKLKLTLQKRHKGGCLRPPDRHHQKQSQKGRQVRRGRRSRGVRRRRRRKGQRSVQRFRTRRSTCQRIALRG